MTGTSKAKRFLAMLIVFAMFTAIPGGFPLIGTKTVAAAESSAKDIANAFGLHPKGEIDDNLANNPYGTDGWFPLFTKSELVELKSYKGKNNRELNVYRYSGNENSTETVGTRVHETVMTTSGGASLTRVTSADLKGTGRKEYIVSLAYVDNDKKLYLSVNDQKTELASVTVETGEMLGDAESYHTTSHMAVVAGDFDADGSDTIVVYSPQQLQIKEYALEGSTLVKLREFHVGDTLGANGKRRLEIIMYTENDQDDDQLRATPSVSMTVEDTDRDGKDELVIASSWNDVPSNNYTYNGERHNVNWQASWISVWDLGAGGWSSSLCEVLQEDNEEQTSGRARFAGVTAGNFSAGSNFPDILAGGYVDQSGGDGTNIDEGKFVLYMYRFNGIAYNRVIYNEVKNFNGFTTGGTYDENRIQDPIAVEAFAGRGLERTDYLFVEGDVYEFNESEGTFAFVTRDDYFKSDDDGIGRFIISDSVIVDVVAANFDGNLEGREQVYFTTSQKYKHGSSYFWRAWEYAFGAADDAGEYPFASKSYDWSLYQEGQSAVTVAAVDIGVEDGMLAKIESKELTYTKPEIMAILEAPPVFAEINGGDLGNGMTEYGSESSDGSGSISGTTVSASVMAGFEYTDPITSSGGGFEATISNTWTNETVTSQERTVEIAYANDMGENTVLMFCTPVTMYTYAVKSKLEGATNTENSMQIGVHGVPATNLMTVETYNKIAINYGMELITEGSQGMLAEPGNPASYRDYLPKSEDETQSWDSGIFTSYSGSGTVSQSVTDTYSEEKSSTYEFMAEVSAFVSVCGAKAGFGVGGGFTSGSISFNSSSVRKEGAVTARPTNVENVENYDFNWKFATWTQKLNGENVPVLGYIVTGVVAPPAPADNLTISEQTEDSMLLTWEPGRGVAAQYTVYRYNPNDPYNTYVYVGQVNGGMMEDNTYSYRLNNLQSGMDYQYVVTSTNAEGVESVYSTPANGRTLSHDMAPIRMYDPADTSALTGQQAQFKVEVYDWGSYRNLAYQWQEKLPSENWQDIAGSKSDVLNVTATELNDGALYRCIVFGVTGDAMTVPFYTGAATLRVGAEDVTPAFEIEDAESGEGSYDKPYISDASYLEITERDGAPVEYDETVTVNIDGSEVPVTKVELTAEDGTAVTEYVVKVGDTYYVLKEENGEYTTDDTRTAAAISTYSYADGEGNTVDGFTFGEPMTVAFDAMDTYYVYLCLNDAQWGTPNGTEGSDGSLRSADIGSVYISIDEETFYAYEEGMLAPGEAVDVPDGCEMVVLYQIVGEQQYLFAHTDTQYEYDSVNESMDEKSVDRFYIATREAEDADTFAIVTQTAQTVFSLDGCADVDISDANLDFVVVTKPNSYIPTVYDENKIEGTVVVFRISTSKVGAGGTAVPASGASFVISMINQTTGTTDTLTGVTDEDGNAAVRWTAPTAGLYAIKVVVGGNETATQYLLATDAKSEQCVLTVSTSQNNKVTTTTYGETLTLSTELVDAENGSKAEVTAVSYKYQLDNSENEVPILTPTAFVPQASGEYNINAYSDADGTLLATTRLTVQKRNAEIRLSWAGMDAGSAVNKSEISLTGENLVAADMSALNNPAVFTVKSEAFKDESGALEANLSGAYTVYIEYTVDEDGYYTAEAEAFKAKYNAMLYSSQFLCLPDAYPVEYTWGENGTLEARYDYIAQIFDSGDAIELGKMLRFVAKPATGFAVDKWYINGEALSAEDDRISTTGNVLSIAAFSSADLGATEEGTQPKLQVVVTFKSASISVSYAVDGDAGGTLHAATAAEEPVANGGSVANGATVIFTAVPDANKCVAKWTVNGADYLWEGSDALYRENTLTIENVDKDLRVMVFYDEGATHTVTATVAPETEGVDVDGIAVSAIDAATNEAADLTSLRDGSAIIFSVPVSDTLGVKEWQVDKGAGFETIEGSGGEASVSVYNITGNWQVKAILTTAQTYALHYKVMYDGAEVTDTAIAALRAEHNGAEIVSGAETPAYIAVQFALTLDDKYYVTEWEHAVEAAGDAAKATLASLNADTEVVVTIAKKAKLTYTAPANGAIQVKVNDSVQTDESYHIPGTAVVVEVTPDNAYVVQKILNTAVNADKANGMQSHTFAITQDTDITVEFAPKPVITIDENAHGTITVRATVDGAEASIEDGDYVDFNSDLAVTLTPSVGYVVADSIDAAYADGTGATTDAKVYTVAAVTAPAEIAGEWTALSSYTVTYSVYDSNAEEDGGMHGEIASVQADRKGLDGYKHEDLANAESLYDGSALTVTALAEDGYRVQEWYINGEVYKPEGITFIGAVLALENLAAFAENEALDIQVKFTRLGENTTVEAGFGGRIASVTLVGSGEDLTDNIDTGFNVSPETQISIVAEVETGYELEGWYVNNVRVADADALEYTHTASADNIGAVIAAKFRQLPYNVFWSAENGTVTATGFDGDSAQIRGGEAVTFTAAADTGYVFSHWMLGNVTIDGEETQTLVWTVPNGMESNTSVFEIKAVFVRGSYTVTYAAPDNGTLEATVDSGTSVLSGENIRFTATPNDGYLVTGWKVNSAVTEMLDAQFTVTVEGDTVVEVILAPNSYNVTYSALAGGTVAAAGDTDGTATVAYGADLILTATPNAYSRVLEWRVNENVVTEGVSADGITLTLTNITADTFVTVSFAEAIGFEVGYTAHENGALNVTANGEVLLLSPGQTNVVPGNATLIFTAEPDTDYMVSGWRVNGTAVTAANASTLGVTMAHPAAAVLAIEQLRANAEVEVTFEEYADFDVPASTADYTVSDVEILPEIDAANKVRKGGDVAFVVAPTAGKVIVSLEVGPDTGDAVTVTRNNDGTYAVSVQGVQAQIVLDAVVTEGVAVTLIAGANGSLTANVGETAIHSGDGVMPGEVIRFTATPNNGYKLDDLQVNGVSIRATRTYTVAATDTVLIVQATFAKNTGGGGGGGGPATLTVKFETNGGSAVANKSVVSNSVLTAPEAPTKDGYNFIGWFTDEALTTAYDFSSKVTKSFTLYAKWEKQEEDKPVEPDWENPFGDVDEDDWFYGDVEFVNKNGLMKGTTETSFAPEENITRAMLVTVLWRLEEEPVVDFLMTFEDVESGSYYEEAVRWANSVGIVAGYSADSFGAEDFITREQIAAIMHRYAQYKAYDVSVGEETNILSYDDFADISEYAIAAMQYAAGAGLMKGKTESTLNPQDFATRAEIAAILHRFIEANK